MAERIALLPSGWRRKILPAVLLLLTSLAFHVNFVVLNRVHPHGDFFAHHNWSEQFADAFREGVVYPRWMPRSLYGMGGPVFLYYPPLFHAAAALTSFLAGNVWDAMRVVAVISTWLTGLFGFAWGRRWLGLRWAFLMAITLQFTPMMALVLLRLNSWGWFASTPALVALMWFGAAPRQAGRLVDLHSAVATMLLVTTHILSGFMALLTLALAQIVPRSSHPASTLLRRPVAWLLSCGLGLGLAMWYLYPALTTQHLISRQEWLAGLGMDWRMNFAFPVVTAVYPGARWLALQWGLAVFALAPALATGYEVWRDRFSNRELAVMCKRLSVTAAASLFFASELSYPLWAHFEALRMLQFPFRFLAPLTIAGVAGNVLSLADASQRGVSRRHRALLALPLALSLAGACAILVLVPLTTRTTRMPSTEVKKEVALREYAPAGAAERYGPVSFDYIVHGGLERECEQRGIRCKQILEKTHERRWQVETDTQARLRLPVFAFPAWSVRIDGQPAAIATAAATGLIEVSIPPGRHEVALRWTGLPEERIGGLGSIAFAAIALCVRIRRGFAKHAGAAR
jgi:hypothetical protein